MSAKDVCELTKEEFQFLQQKTIEINIASEAILDILKQIDKRRLRENLPKQVAVLSDAELKKLMREQFSKKQKVYK